MSQNSILLDKSLKFAVRIVKLYQYLSKEKKPSSPSRSFAAEPAIMELYRVTM